MIQIGPIERNSADYFTSDPFTTDGVEWIQIWVQSTNPPGALCRWLTDDGGVVAECVEGDRVDVLFAAWDGELTISIIPGVNE